jgi:hypothetical protein
MYQLLEQPVKYAFHIYGIIMILIVNGIYSLNSINKFILVMMMCCVLFEVRTEFLNII